jgi:hypothetical protein
MKRKNKVVEINLRAKYPEIHNSKIKKSFMYENTMYVWSATKMYVYSICNNQRKPPAMSIFAQAVALKPELVDKFHIALPDEEFWVFGPWYKQGNVVINIVTGTTTNMTGAIKYATDTEIKFRVVKRIYGDNGVFKTPMGTITLKNKKLECSSGVLLHECNAVAVFKYEKVTYIWARDNKVPEHYPWNICIHNADRKILYNVYKSCIHDVHGMWARDNSGWFTIFNKRSQNTQTSDVLWADHEQIVCIS